MGTAASALETCEEAPRKKSWAKSCSWGLWWENGQPWRAQSRPRDAGIGQQVLR